MAGGHRQMGQFQHNLTIIARGVMFDLADFGTHHFRSKTTGGFFTRVAGIDHLAVTHDGRSGTQALHFFQTVADIKD